MKTPQKLKEVLEQFTPVYTIDGLTRQFEDIAQVVFNGHFVVNGEYEIYPIYTFEDLNFFVEYLLRSHSDALYCFSPLK